jgi:hypothetical protein
MSDKNVPRSTTAHITVYWCKCEVNYIWTHVPRAACLVALTMLAM